MKLTLKDKDFLDVLTPLVESGTLWIDLESDGLKRLVLRRNYGAGVESAFGMSRQGVRWRFQRLAEMYVSAYETILFVERALGAELRTFAVEIARERAELRRRARETGGFRGHRRETGPEVANRTTSE